MKRHNQTLLAACTACLILLFAWPYSTLAIIQGPCSDCHTMHNSQGGDPMNWDASATPNENLTRGTCYGCHAQGVGTPTVILATDAIPQVYKTNGVSDLAAGNFWHIENGGSNRGHNIAGLTADEALSMYPPPGIIGPSGSVHDDFWNDHKLSCISSEKNQTAGCHGLRQKDNSAEGISGAHHNNVDGQLNLATDTGNSYRFLFGVKGYEDNDWEITNDSGDHNEYLGITEPIQLGCGGGGIVNCHSSGADGTLELQDGTMSQFCASCHGNFHTLETPNYDGIGPDSLSPFIRHPTDLALPDSGEYLAYSEYSVQAPVARTAGVPAGSGSGVSHGANGDAVMCLSCHRAHASPYPDMLRWEYNDMVVGSGNAGGCFTCHTTKN